MDNAFENHSQSFLSLQVSGQYIALAVDNVQEVINYEAPVKVPGSLPFIAGLLVLRGKVVTVIDTGILLGIYSVLDNTDNPLVLMVKHGEELYGLIVSAVGEVFYAEPNNIEILPNNFSDSIKAISDGLYKGPQNLYTIIAIDKFFGSFA